MNETPRTDARVITSETDERLAGELVDAGFCRAMERELQVASAFVDAVYPACCYLDRAVPVQGYPDNAARIRAAADLILKLRQQPPSVVTAPRLPARQEERGTYPGANEYARGWNDALDAVRDLSEPPTNSGVDTRSCTCHPDDNPPRPCPRKYALTECREAHARRGV